MERATPWVHRGRLEHLLPPAAYFDPGFADREWEALFRSGCHLLGTRSSLFGRRLVEERELFGIPLALRKEGTSVRAFTRGPTPSRPIELTVRSLGELLFVSLDPEARPLAETFDEQTTTVAERAFTPDHRHLKSYRNIQPCNWKVPIENVLETYHVAMLHQNPLARRPELFQVFSGTRPGQPVHRLGPSSTSYFDTMGARSKIYRRLADRLRPDLDTGYEHLHAFPNLILAHSHLVSFAQTSLPLTPRTCLVESHLFAHEGATESASVKLLRPLVRAAAALFMGQVLEEDAAVYRSVQRGLEASRQAGSLSAREERVHAFQAYVSRSVSG